MVVNCKNNFASGSPTMSRLAEGVEGVDNSVGPGGNWIGTISKLIGWVN